jgi:hypothetical protein
MVRLQADADPSRWMPVTGSFGFGGRRARKKAIRMLLTQANPAAGSGARPGGGFAAWAVSQATPWLMRKADGRVLVWVWKDDPELLVVMAQAQQATPQLRTARAMMPMEYDDTESFRGTYLGEGERLVMPLPPARPDGSSPPPFATYTWDTGTHFVSRAVRDGRGRRRRPGPLTAPDRGPRRSASPPTSCVSTPPERSRAFRAWRAAGASPGVGERTTAGRPGGASVTGGAAGSRCRPAGGRRAQAARRGDPQEHRP